MATKLIKKKTLNKGIKETAEENVRVVKTKAKEEPEVIKEGLPLDHTPQHNINKTSPRTVGVNLGVTKNMQNYESLRVDCWITDVIEDNETPEDAFNRIYDVACKVIAEKVEELMED